MFEIRRSWSKRTAFIGKAKFYSIRGLFSPDVAGFAPALMLIYLWMTPQLQILSRRTAGSAAVFRRQVACATLIDGLAVRRVVHLCTMALLSIWASIAEAGEAHSYTPKPRPKPKPTPHPPPQPPHPLPPPPPTLNHPVQPPAPGPCASPPGPQRHPPSGRETRTRWPGSRSLESQRWEAPRLFPNPKPTKGPKGPGLPSRFRAVCHVAFGGCLRWPWFLAETTSELINC